MGWHILPDEEWAKDLKCRKCQKQIEINTKFYFENASVNPPIVIHAICLWEEIDQEILDNRKAGEEK